MRQTKPIKIETISSNLSICNLHPNQKIIINKNFSVKNNGLFLTENNKIFSQKENIKNWNFSNLYLANLEVQNKNICVFLNFSSKIYTIINPKNSFVKIDSDKIIEIILFSKDKNNFSFRNNNFSSRYNVFDNYKLNDILPMNSFSHHIWLFTNQIGFFNFEFHNGLDFYSLKLNIKKSKQKENQHYKRNILLVRK